ncbi:MAG: shikimate kinase [Tenacibaculum sp.]|nr:shikimate kinase [Tenacibaculum sp.]
MKIILLGYMASGKSTIGKLLAENSKMKFIDLDDFIEKKEKKTISFIFKEKGEVYFRLKEHEYLKELLNKKEDFILSLGGGTPCYAKNMDIVLANKNTVSIYLKSTIKTIVKRLEEDNSERPLITNLSKNDLVEFVSKHLFERSFFYEQANIKVDINNKSIKEIVEEIRVFL